MSPAAGGPSVLRVVTLNLASGRDARGRVLDAAAIARALLPLAELAPDVVALQEVDADQPRSGGADQAAVVADVLGMAHWRGAPALLGTPGPFKTWEPAQGLLVGAEGPEVSDGPTGPGRTGAVPPGPRYGVALLVSRPVVTWHVLPLEGGAGRLPLRVRDPRTGRMRWWAFPDEPRVALAARLDGGAGAAESAGSGVWVATTHLSFAPVTARRQLHLVRAWLAGLVASGGGGGRSLLAGDLNLPRRLLPRDVDSLVAAATFPAAAPRLQLDHVLELTAPAPVDAGSGSGEGRGGERATTGRPLALDVGDHRALLVDVAL